MNPFDFVRAEDGGSLVYLLLGIIWVAISLLSNRQKKKKQEEMRRLQRERMEREALERENTPEPAQAAERSVVDRIEREFETVLKEEGTDAEGEPAEVQQDFEGTNAEPQDAEHQSRPAPEGPARVPVYTVLPPVQKEAEFKPYAFSEDSSPAIAESAITDASADNGNAAVPEVEIASRHEARRGFLWSEILAPPRSLRE